MKLAKCSAAGKDNWHNKPSPVKKRAVSNLLADSGETIVVIPVTGQLIEVELALPVPVVEHRSTLVAVVIEADRREMCDAPSVTLPKEYSL